MMIYGQLRPCELKFGSVVNLLDCGSNHAI